WFGRSWPGDDLSEGHALRRRSRGGRHVGSWKHVPRQRRRARSTPETIWRAAERSLVGPLRKAQPLGSAGCDLFSGQTARRQLGCTSARKENGKMVRTTQTRTLLLMVAALFAGFP